MFAVHRLKHLPLRASCSAHVNPVDCKGTLDVGRWTVGKSGLVTQRHSRALDIIGREDYVTMCQLSNCIAWTYDVRLIIIVAIAALMPVFNAFAPASIAGRSVAKNQRTQMIS